MHLVAYVLPRRLNMSHDDGTSETVGELCEQVDTINEFVDTAKGTEITAKLREQIERLQGVS